MINPSLIDVLDRFKDQIFSSLNCVGIGKIESISPDKKYATLSMAYKTRRVGVDDSGREFSEPVDYPALVDCPIIRVSGGNSGLWLPVQVGDNAIIYFNDVDMDAFITSKNVTEPETSRLHSFSDAIAFVGLENEVKDFGESAALYKGDSSISLDGTLIEIKNNSHTLLALMLEFIGIIKTLAPLTSTPSNPTSPNPADATKLQLLETKLQGLLK